MHPVIKSLVLSVPFFVLMACDSNQLTVHRDRVSTPTADSKPTPTFCESHPNEALYETQDHLIIREFKYTHFRNCAGKEISASWETTKSPTKNISLPKKICKAMVHKNTYVGMVNMNNCKNLGYIFQAGENCSITLDRSYGMLNAQVEEGINDINFYIHNCPESKKTECEGKILNETYLAEAVRLRLNISYEEKRLTEEQTIDPPDCEKKPNQGGH